MGVALSSPLHQTAPHFISSASIHVSAVQTFDLRGWRWRKTDFLERSLGSKYLGCAVCSIQWGFLVIDPGEFCLRQDGGGGTQVDKSCHRSQAWAHLGG